MGNEELYKMLQSISANTDATNVALSAPKGDFVKNQPNLSRQQVDSTDNPSYVEAGVPSWIVDALMGGASKGIPFLGKLASKLKFPKGYGAPSWMMNTAKPHSNIDNLIKKADDVLMQKELSKVAQKPQISSLIPDQLAKIRANTPPNPNLSKMILRNDPAKKRLK